jgi:ubiquinone/menaquinone biosynthesis C-methylase UbiE
MQPFDQIVNLYQEIHGDNPHQVAMVDRIAANLTAGAAVLDLGSGSGIPTAARFAGLGMRVTGVDLSEKMIVAARQQVPNADFQQADFRSLTFETGCFEAVTAFFSLLMLSKAEIEKVLPRIRRWLRPGGFFAFSMVDFDGDEVPVEFLGVSFKASGYTPDALTALLDRSGFRSITVERNVFQSDAQDSERQIFVLCQTPRGLTHVEQCRHC